jgi:hypothetical protein
MASLPRSGSARQGRWSVSGRAVRGAALLWQWRSYGWSGQGFGQVGGPSAFPVNPSVTETVLAAGELVLGPAIDGVRHGTLTDSGLSSLPSRAAEP